MHRGARRGAPTDPAPQSYKGVSYQTDPSQADNVFGTVGNFLIEGDVAGFTAGNTTQSNESEKE